MTVPRPRIGEGEVYQATPAHQNQKSCKHLDHYRSPDKAECSVCGSKVVNGHWSYLTLDWYTWYINWRRTNSD